VLCDGTPPVRAIPYRVPVAKDDRMGEVGDRGWVNVNEVGELEDEAEVEVELPVPVVLAKMALKPMEEEEVTSILLEFMCLKGTVRGIVPIPGRPVFVVTFEFVAEVAVPVRRGKPSSLVSTGLSSSTLGSASSTCIASESSGESDSACSSPSTIVVFTPFSFSYRFTLALP